MLSPEGSIFILSFYGRAQQGDRIAEDGGRQNEVLLRTLKRTRLAQRVHAQKKTTRGVNY